MTPDGSATQDKAPARPPLEREEGEGPDIRIRLGGILYERGISQVDLAERIGIHPTSLNKLIGGKFSMLRRETILAICKELDIQPGDWIVYA